ncbi:hypothetical protein [Ruegeria sp. HKCCD7255]|uniref:hypothetical protein n=1 Tax=Ruegeria sp. HKCCD7255 TaxID=2683004 RepID=UPI001488E8B2|nr:hypothetical protein [Ruegeria sp. HKCCD7255]
MHALLRSALALHQFSLLEPNQTQNLDTISRANDALNIGLYNAMASDWAALYQPGSSIQLYHDEAPPRGEFFQQFSYSYFLGIGDVVFHLPTQNPNEELENLVRIKEKHVFHLLERHPARDQFAKQLSTPLNPVTPEAWQASAHTGIIPFFEQDDARPRSEVERPHPTGSNWEFWREWYQSFIDGKPMDQELLRRIALTLDDYARRNVEQRVEQTKSELENTRRTAPVPNKATKHEKALVTNAVAQNRDAIAVSVVGLLDQIDTFREKIRGMNSLEAGLRREILEFTDCFHRHLQQLLESLPQQDNDLTEERAGRIALWLRDYKYFLWTKLAHYSSPENMAQATAPTCLVLGATGIGAMLGQPLAGVLVGGLITNQLKPTQAAKEFLKSTDT